MNTTESVTQKLPSIWIALNLLIFVLLLTPQVVRADLIIEMSNSERYTDKENQLNNLESFSSELLFFNSVVKIAEIEQLRETLLIEKDVANTVLTLSGTFTANSKVYDATTSATILENNLRLTGVIGEDDVSISTITLAFGSKNVGSGKTVSITGFTLSGADADKYSSDITGAPTTTAEITTGTLLVRGLSGNNKAYDGSTTATVSGTPSLEGVLGEDVVTLTGTPVFRFDSAVIGTRIQITTTGFILGGSDANNYSLIQPILSANITAGSLVKFLITFPNEIFENGSGNVRSPNSVYEVQAGSDIKFELRAVDRFNYISSDNYEGGLNIQFIHEGSNNAVIDSTIVNILFDPSSDDVNEFQFNISKSGKYKITVTANNITGESEFMVKPSIPIKLLAVINNVTNPENELISDVNIPNTLSLKLEDNFGNLYDESDFAENFDFKLTLSEFNILELNDLQISLNNLSITPCSSSNILRSENCTITFSNESPNPIISIISTGRGKTKLTLESNSFSMKSDIVLKFFATPNPPKVVLINPNSQYTLDNESTVLSFNKLKFEIESNDEGYVPSSYNYTGHNDPNDLDDPLDIEISDDLDLKITLVDDQDNYWNKSEEFEVSIKFYTLNSNSIFPDPESEGISTYPTFSTALSQEQPSRDETSPTETGPSLKVLLDRGQENNPNSSDRFVSIDPNNEYTLDADTEYTWYTCLESGAPNVFGACSESYTFTTRETVRSYSGSINKGFKVNRNALGYQLLAFPFSESKDPTSFLTGKPIYDWRIFDINFNENNLNFEPGNALWVISKNSFEIDQGYEAAIPDAQDIRTVSVNNGGWSPFSLPFLTNDIISVNELATFNNVVPESLRIYEWSFEGQDWSEVTQNSTLKTMTGYVIKVTSNVQSSTLDLDIPYTSLEKRDLQYSTDKVPTKEVFLSAIFDDNVTSRILLTETPIKSQIPHLGNPKTTFALSQNRGPENEILYSTYPIESIGEDIQLVLRSELFNQATLKLEGADSENYALLLLDDEDKVRYHITSETVIPISVSGNSLRYNLKLIGLDELNELLEAELPTETALMQNYPNPFNPSTQIRFSLTSDSPVKIQIYDLLGRSVMTLVDQELKAGWHSVVLNNTILSSGVYLYTMSTPEYRFTRKMTLIK